MAVIFNIIRKKFLKSQIGMCIKFSTSPIFNRSTTYEIIILVSVIGMKIQKIVTQRVEKLLFYFI